MKFIALLIASVAAADIASTKDCSAKDAKCADKLCCGTVVVDKASVGETFAPGPTTKVCFLPATAEALKTKKTGSDYPIPKAGDKTAVTGGFLCAAADAAAASYMTVGAAAIIAAAALLQ